MKLNLNLSEVTKSRLFIAVFTVLMFLIIAAVSYIITKGIVNYSFELLMLSSFCGLVYLLLIKRK